MAKEYLFFISHSSKDNALALELKNILIEMHPEWADQIFLDCSAERPLDKASYWYNEMLQAVENSRDLIFITSNMDYIKQGQGWLYEEVSTFRALQATHVADGRPDKNVSYFGIFLCDCDFKKELFNDPNMGDTYRSLYQWSQHLLLGEGASLQKEKERIRAKVMSMIESE